MSIGQPLQPTDIGGDRNTGQTSEAMCGRAEICTTIWKGWQTSHHSFCSQPQACTGMHAQVVHTAYVSLYAQSQIAEAFPENSLIVTSSHAGLLAVA